MVFRRTVLLCGVCLLGAACVPRQAEPETRPEPPVVEEPAVPEPQGPDPEELYARLERGLADYDAAIELIVAGEEVLGERRHAAAAEELRSAAEECAGVEGCELERFFDVFDRLLDEQSIALKTQASRILELEASAAEQELEREPGTSPFVAVIPEVGRTVSLLRGTELQEIITLNGPVNAALDDWLTWMRPMLMEAWENYQFLRDEIAPIYEAADLPEALLFAMMATESGGKVHSVSRAGAAGPLQFMRYTARHYGLGVDQGFDMRLDPAAATRANVAYLNDRFGELNNSLEKALAAYNGGENRVRSLHRRHRGASLWDSRVYYSLPRETREYVPRVLAAAWLFLHPADYNLEFPVIDTDKAHLVLQQPIAIDELAVCLGQTDSRNGWFRTLRNLNPRLGPGERVESGQEIVVPARLVPVYEERCLDGPTLERARRLHDANYPEEPEMIPYVVRRGDTLGRIASRNRCVSLRELADINRVRPPRYMIRVGQRLQIPKCN